MSYIQWIRRHVGHQKILVVFASACVQDDAGRVLWQRRADFGWWGLPGGVLELDESLPECVVREVREESGLEVSPTRLIGIYSSPDFDVTYPNGDMAQQVTVCFECRVQGASPTTPDAQETLDLAWFDSNQLPPTSPWYAAMVADLTLGQNTARYDHGSSGHTRSSQPFFRQMRQHIGQAAYTMPAAVAIIKDETGRVLLQRRGDTGDWGLPGGAMELGERIDQTVIHEVQEETGLYVQPTRLIGVYSDQDFELTYPHGDQCKVVSALFECVIVGGCLVADGVESLELRFFPPHALPPLMRRHIRRIRDASLNQAAAVF